ncbi:hypothetical protein DPMN_076501 [Dreissena polymorpha]|uniref:Uncharacterized protein n=1 Tax=Dreissena polymorpha TaxID=45954 RepID=A0A9D3YIT0_DREPO|nr:hypothetical protein DPMN_076501 [Dreissena polymorpha]
MARIGPVTTTNPIREDLKSRLSRGCEVTPERTKTCRTWLALWATHAKVQCVRLRVTASGESGRPKVRNLLARIGPR